MPVGVPPTIRRKKKKPRKRTTEVTTETAPATMVTGGSMTAPANAEHDESATMAEQEMQAFFSTGTGAAMHYDAQPGVAGTTGEASTGEAGTTG